MQLNIPGHTIGEGHPIFLVAEMSANHLQNFDRAVAIIRAAKKAGADAIKLQTYTPGTMTLDCNNEYFQIKQGTLWDGTTLYKLYQQAYTPWEWFPELQRVAQEEGLVFFSAAFDPTAVDFLEELGVPFHKVASFEITDVALVEKMAKTGKPMIISTGIASLSDIELAVETCRKAGNNNLILLKCTSAYPAPIEEANVLHIPLFQETFGVLAGLSDHTPGTTVPILSVGLGARMIEKHFTLDRASGGVDAAFSLEPDEFTQMVQAVRQAEKALGSESYARNEKTQEKARVFARSLFVVENMKEGETFSPANVRSIRPGFGLHPRFLDQVLGRKCRRNVAKGTPMKWEWVD